VRGDWASSQVIELRRVRGYQGKAFAHNKTPWSASASQKRKSSGRASVFKFAPKADHALALLWQIFRGHWIPESLFL